MAGALLTQGATLTCPHGGTVTAVPGQTRATAGGAAILGVDATFTIAGCPFTIPSVPPIPSPCVQILWVVPDLRVRAGSQTLSAGSVGMCISAAGIPQGPAVITPAQTRATST